MRGHPPAGEGGAHDCFLPAVEWSDTPPLCREPQGGGGEWRWGHTALDFLLKTLERKHLTASIESSLSLQEGKRLRHSSHFTAVTAYGGAPVSTVFPSASSSHHMVAPTW